MRHRRSFLRLYHRDEDTGCVRVRMRLEELGVAYAAVEVPASPEERTELLDLSGQRRVPVLVDGEILVVGVEEVLAYLERVFPIPPHAVE